MQGLGRRVGWAVLGAALAAAPVACGSSQGPCKDDYDCNATEVCRVATGECEKAVCRADADCLGKDLACVDNACVPTHCQADGDCGKAGYVCTDGACAVAPTP